MGLELLYGDNKLSHIGDHLSELKGEVKKNCHLGEIVEGVSLMLAIKLVQRQNAQ